MLKFTSYFKLKMEPNTGELVRLPLWFYRKRVIDSRWCGLIDAVESGWFKQDTDEVFEGFKITAEDIVFEAGCGVGNTTMFCANRGAHVIFLDVDRLKMEELELKVKVSNARAYQAIVSDADPIPLAANTASKIIAMEVLEHTREPERVLRELVRVGQPGALYLLTVPDALGEKFQQQFAPAAYFQEPNHIQIFEREQFERMVTDAGLIIEKRMFYGFFWLAWMTLYWISKKDTKTLVEGAVLDDIGPPYHPLLQAWATLWRMVIKMPSGLKLKKTMDQLFPKSQGIIARKPR